MGVSSTAIFGDDTACDVRDAYRDLLANGLSGPEATDRLLREWRETIDDQDDGPVFWLALASAQWTCGRLEKRVKTKTLEIIDNGSSLGLWSEGGDSRMLQQRQAVLAKLRAKLKSPQPAVKKISKPPKNDCPWTVGEVLAYRLRSGKSVFLHVVDTCRPKVGGWWAIFAILNWLGNKMPTAERIKNLRLKMYRGTTDPYLIAVMNRKKDFPEKRITRLAIRRKPHQRRITGGYGVIFWKELDAYLRGLFRLK
jgi:hypothetical protein